jgi:thiol-disulfide isomerase/thioredoxin
VFLRSALLTGIWLVFSGGVEPVERFKTPVAAKEQATDFYPAEANGPAVLETALAKARAEDKLAVIVFGADWCHDSRGLARVLLSDAFKARFGARFTVTFIDVAVPQTGNGRNLELVKQLGVKKLKSTPAMFVISPNGKRINSKKDVVSWRNADSRGEPAILAWFDAVLADQAK